MKSFWRHGDPLERELRAQRPQPRTNFLLTLESRISSEGHRRPARRLRLGLAAALTVAMLTALASFGGLSYAATGVSHAVQAATHVVAPAHQAAPTQKTQPLSSAQAQYRVAMCFLRHTIYVDSHAVRILERLGAKLGPCKGGRRTPPETTKVVCIKGHNIRVTAKDAKALIKARKANRGFCKA
jgi:hypothetical protein